MSWTDFYRRRDAIDAVLAHAEQHPRWPACRSTSYRQGSPTARAWRSPLQYKWSQVLTGHIGTALSETDRKPDADHVEAVAAAWRLAARPAPGAAWAAGPVHDRGRPGVPPDATGRAADGRVRRRSGRARRTGRRDRPDRGPRSSPSSVVHAQPVSRRTSVEQLFRRLVASS